MRPHLFFVLALASVLSTAGQAAAAQPGVQEMIPAAEYNALADLYNSAGGPLWLTNFASPNGVLPANNGWLNPAAAFWNGVVITGVQYDAGGGVSTPGHVQIINLANANLTGTLPASLGNLSELAGLSLQGNSLTGGIPASLAHLAQLQYLWLANNQLTGGIPAGLGSLAQLQSLDLRANPHLEGAIPASFGGLSQLQGLLLQGDGLSGSIPAELGSLTNLQSLSLGGNQLSGDIPASFGGLTRLTALDLSGNNLTGSIPPALGNLTSLFVLHLENNLLSGSIAPLQAAYFPSDSQNALNLSANFFEIAPGSSNLAVINAMLAVPERVIYAPQIPPQPTLAAQPQTTTAPAGTNASFYANANGLPPLSYQWLFQGSVVPGQTGPSLTVSNVQPAEVGSYAVWITNAAGSVLSSNAYLFLPDLAAAVISPPTPVRTGVALVVSTTAGISYVLECTESLEAPAWNPVQSFTGNGGMVTLTDPSPSPTVRYYRTRIP